MRFSKEAIGYCNRLAGPLVRMGDSEAHRTAARDRVATMVRNLRGKGRRDLAREVMRYVCWIGYPVK